MFSNDTVDAELLATTRPIAGRLEGTYGVSGGSRRFDARRRRGAVAARRPGHRVGLHLPGSGVAAPDAAVRRPRRAPGFTPGRRPAAARLHQRQRIARRARSGRPTPRRSPSASPAPSATRPSRSCTSTARTPATSPSRSATTTSDAERALGLDVAFRWRLPHVTGEVAYFRNAVDDFIFRQPTGEIDRGLPGHRVHRRDVAAPGRRGARRHRDRRRAWSSSSAPTTSAASCATPAIRCRGCRRCAPPSARAIGSTRCSSARRSWPRPIRTASSSAETPTAGAGVRQAVRRLLEADQGGPAHDHAAPRQRHQRDLPEPPVLHQGPGAGGRPQREAGLRRQVLTARDSSWRAPTRSSSARACA